MRSHSLQCHSNTDDGLVPETSRSLLQKADILYHCLRSHSLQCYSNTDDGSLPETSRSLLQKADILYQNIYCNVCLYFLNRSTTTV